MMAPNSQYFHMHLQDLRFAADFYSKIYDRRFSGRRENNFRTSLIRDSTISGALYRLDKQLDVERIVLAESRCPLLKQPATM
jgi:anaphase-promoting complex subunit 1